MPSILVVDDQSHMRTVLALMLREAGYDVSEAPDGLAGSDAVKSKAFDLVLTDLRMGARDGLSLLRAVKERQPLAEVIVMTAYGTIESAVEAMRLGAFDYLQKPFTEEHLRSKVERALRRRRPTEGGPAPGRAAGPAFADGIIGESARIRDVISRVQRIAQADTTVLITGESGTGKELIAHAIHRDGRRAARPLVAVNCAAISPDLLDSELFGHARGAFTGAVEAHKGLFEAADQGTLFLDEVAEIPPTLQVKLLRVLQEHEVRRVGESKPIRVDVRIIAATNVNLQEAVQAKRFREDLYYRLDVIRLHMPPLRERREDIPLLVDHFLEIIGDRLGRKLNLHPDALAFLEQHDFPGNVRELINYIEQGIALAEGPMIELKDLSPTFRQGEPDDFDLRVSKLEDVVAAAERRKIEETLRDLAGDKEAAAERLGLSATTLWRKMKRLQIRWPGN